ncbi:MAG: SRPBCC family protein [Saprospiraceae bacterium]|nr:SRPBCC family protein [Saprospiraceae bacterium]MCF8248531.1 SRPBCC family protein [Saprospiraceae bacterium]MCF8283068.1 SRPBCC family protein [Bacteroidales bacterium]MCF8310265.1 SRPBCC family protein [Saprospiraceae bacterium]MCF8439296.1 SRPBCC family protein [Saprospiraceae bacterium]
MPDYQFITVWKFDHPLPQVWKEIKAMSLWPEWWSFVAKVKILKQGDANEIGAIRRITWKTALPYSLTFDSELVEEIHHRRMEGRAFGELDGVGIWNFTTIGSKTIVRYEWQVKTTKAWMNLLAPIARPIFSWNHDKVMKAGFVGLKKRLENKSKN